MTRVAVLDDWQNAAESSADWGVLRSRAEVVFFRSPFADEAAAASALIDFDVVMAMRERTPFPVSLVARLPKLRMFNLTGARAACSCGDPSTGYMLPTLFNVAAYQWILCASLAGVVLMAATAVRGWNQFAPAAAPTPLAK